MDKVNQRLINSSEINFIEYNFNKQHTRSKCTKQFLDSCEHEFQEFLINFENNTVTCKLSLLEFLRFPEHKLIVLKLDKKINFKMLYLCINLQSDSKRYNLICNMKNNSLDPAKYSSFRNNTYNNINQSILPNRWERTTRHSYIHSVIIIYSLSKQVDNIWLKDLNDKKFTDFTIVVNNDKKFQVHKMLLYYKSKVFQKMIDLDMQEKKTNSIQLKYEVPLVQEFINYMYKNECDFRVGVHDLYRLAHMYEIEDLQIECEFDMLNKLEDVKNITESYKLINVDQYKFKYLKKEVIAAVNIKESELVLYDDYLDYNLSIMSIDNIDFMFNLAVKYNNENFSSGVKDFIREHADDVFKNENLKKMLVEHPNVFEEKFVNFYLNAINPSNAHLIFQLAMENENEQFKTNVMKYLKENGKEILKNENFRNILKEHPEWAIDNFIVFLLEK